MVEVWYFVSCEHVLLIHGRYISSNREFYLFNVYAPRADQKLWDYLSAQLQLLGAKGMFVCVGTLMLCDVWKNEFLLEKVTCLCITSLLISLLMIMI